MNLRPQRREDPEINLTPLIDVVFLMLIFFVVSTTFVRESSLKITLPEASPPVQQAATEVLELVIDAEGDYFIGGKPLVNRQLDTVRRALEQSAGGSQQRPLVIRADARTPHQAVVTAMDAAGRAGLTRLSIATTPTEDSQ